MQVAVIASFRLSGGRITLSARDIRAEGGEGAAGQVAASALRSRLSGFSTSVDPGELPFSISATELRAEDGVLVVSGHRAGRRPPRPVPGPDGAPGTAPGTVEPMQDIRWGIVGPGRIAESVVADFAARGRRAAGRRRLAVGERARGVRRPARGSSARHGSYAEILADPDVDVLYVATPHPQHHAIALAP